MRTIILILMIIFAINAIARAEAAPRPVQAMLAYGSEVRPEKDVDGNQASHNLTNLSFGAGFGTWLAMFERATYEESSGNATLNLKRKFEDSLIWIHYRTASWNYMIPYLGAGTGFYKNTVDTTLGGITTSNESKNKLIGGGCFGVSLDVPYLWLSAEARLLFGDELDRQPTIGGLVRMGAYF
jgi:hypothetical protein